MQYQMVTPSRNVKRTTASVDDVNNVRPRYRRVNRREQLLVRVPMSSAIMFSTRFFFVLVRFAAAVRDDNNNVSYFCTYHALKIIYARPHGA